jgi:hypothetical protein
MITRDATCSCGELCITCTGEPIRVSICHCLACQKRTGSAFGVQARFASDQIATARGSRKTYTRIADSGNRIEFHFCADCGSTLWWEPSALPGFVVVAVGAFADPSFMAPSVSIYEARRHPWTEIGADFVVQHLD